MKKLRLYFICLLVCSTILSCKKDNESNNPSNNYFFYDGETYGLNEGYFIKYGETPNGNYEFDIYMFSNLIIYNPDLVVGNGNAIGFNILTASSTISTGEYNYNDEWDIAGTFRIGEFILKWNENDPDNQVWTYINYGVISIQNTNNVFDISFDCTSREGKNVKGRFTGKPTFFDGR